LQKNTTTKQARGNNQQAPKTPRPRPRRRRGGGYHEKGYSPPPFD